MDEETIDLSALWLIIKKKLNVIIITTLLVTMISGISTFFLMVPKYTSTVAVFINDLRATNSGGTENQTINDLNMYQKLVETYAGITKSRTVAEDVIAELNLNLSIGQLQSIISSSTKGNTQFLNIRVTSSDRELSYKIANQMALSLKTVSKELRGMDIVQTLDAANVPNSPSSPNLKMNLVIGFMLGLMVSLFGVFILEFLDQTIKNPSNIDADDCDMPFLGSLPHVPDSELY